jgi:hypothetical protein
LTGEWPLFCARCSGELKPGSGGYYLVTVEAVADPAGPEISDDDLQGDIEGEIRKLISTMEQMPASEAMDQVHRRLNFCLCTPCYRTWIENPTG